MRICLVVGVVISALFAMWSWLRPYEWGADSGAGCRVVGTQVRKDQTFYWVDLHLKLLNGIEHDLRKPVRLICETGTELEPADTTLGGDKDRGTTDLWFKFWLQADDLTGELKLRINDGELSIRSKRGLPKLGSNGIEYFVTNRW